MHQVPTLAGESRGPHLGSFPMDSDTVGLIDVPLRALLEAEPDHPPQLTRQPKGSPGATPRSLSFPICHPSPPCCLFASLSPHPSTATEMLTKC